MDIPANSIGSAVPRAHFDAAVHSVFESALNLKPKGEDLLLTVFVSADGHLPQGIRLDPASGFRCSALQMQSRVTCRDGVLRFHGDVPGIDLREARRWECDLSSLRPRMNDPAVEAGWRCAWQALNERQLHEGPGLVAVDLGGDSAGKQAAWAQRMSKSMQTLFHATRTYDANAAGTLEPLIGLGPGLTPSGDDLITGYLTGLWCTCKGRAERLGFLLGLGKAVVDLSKRTNDISRTYLFHATRGLASSQLVNLAVAICTGAGDERVLPYANAAMHSGHTSGMDAVTGLLFGLAAWDGANLLA